MNKKTLKDIVVKGKKVFVRCDFNVPQDEQGAITDDIRIVSALPTIKYLLEAGAKVVLSSHLGRPKGEFNQKYSLKPICERLNKYLDGKVILASDVIGEDAKKKIAALKDGEAILIENVRFHKEEEKNDAGFSKNLAEGIDIFVNDAFGTAHRAHSSTTGIADFVSDSAVGFLIQKELDIIGGALKNPKRPFVAVLGGKKVSDKIGVITNLFDKVDSIIIGGAMAYTFIVAKGGKVGNSRVEMDKLDLALQLLKTSEEKGVKIHLPCDTVVAKEFSNNVETVVMKTDEIKDGYEGLDIGPKTRENYTSIIAAAKTIIWNGPMGVFEFSNFEAGTRAVAEALVNNKEATTIIGGGDSAAAVEQFGLAKGITHISTGGGASLEYLEGKILPGIACIADILGK